MTRIDRGLIEELCCEARSAVLDHRDDHPTYSGGCMWCEDGRLSHWLSDCREFYGDETADAVSELYREWYR